MSYGYMSSLRLLHPKVTFQEMDNVFKMMNVEPCMGYKGGWPVAMQRGCIGYVGPVLHRWQNFSAVIAVLKVKSDTGGRILTQ